MTSETFSACWCPVTSVGVLHNYDCFLGGRRARTYASANEASIQVSVNPYSLSRRELEVAKLLVMGHSNKEIAHLLTITLSTVKAHVSVVLQRTAAANRTQAAYRLGSYFGTHSAG